MIKLFIKLITKEAYKKFLFFEQKGGTNTARQITVNEFRLKERKKASLPIQSSHPFHNYLSEGTHGCLHLA